MMGGLARGGVLRRVHADSGVDSAVDTAEYMEAWEEERVCMGLDAAPMGYEKEASCCCCCCCGCCGCC